MREWPVLLLLRLGNIGSCAGYLVLRDWTGNGPNKCYGLALPVFLVWRALRFVSIRSNSFAKRFASSACLAEGILSTGSITNLTSRLQSIDGHDVALYVVGPCQIGNALLAPRHTSGNGLPAHLLE